MFPVKKILTPTDFSKPSEAGLRVAIKVARHFEAELIVFHVVSPLPVIMTGDSSMAAYHMPKVMDELEKGARDALKDLMNAAMPPNVKASFNVAHGNPADEIVRLADEAGVDMIIIATHGQAGWRRFLFGSVAEKVIRIAGCPVLTIPEPDGGE